LIYLVLGLLEVEALAQKVQRMENRTAARVIAGGTVAAATKLRRYMLVRTLMSVLTGLLVWAFAAAIGLDYAAEWGIIAFVLNYIPFIGSFIATLLPTLFALAQFASWQLSLAVFASLNVIQFVVGSYIEPRVAGDVLAIFANDHGGGRVLLGLPMGIAGCLHRCSDRHRPAGICRPASLDPLVG
jgi:AI-2 transport protein TqsA